MIKVHRFLASTVSILGLAIASIPPASATPADVFQPHLEEIQQQLPTGYQLRLPSEILLGGPGLSPEDLRKLIVRVQPDDAQLTISLLTCESGPHPCLVGSIATASAQSREAQLDLYFHELLSAPVTLAPDVVAYVQDGDRMKPASDYSSAMWEQDGMIYKVTFLGAERQNILFMARSMATQQPIISGTATNNPTNN
jgi:hypothetical protein